MPNDMQYKINDQHPHGQAVPPHQTNWIDYPKAEAALFSAIRSELRLIAIDHQHHFGAEAVRMVNQIAEAIYPKALDILQQHGTRRAFSDRHLWEKCQNWAEWWCARLAHRRRKRPHTKYSETSASLGRTHSQAKRSNKARIRALLVQLHHREGRTLRQIADQLRIGKSTAGDAMRRSVGLLYTVVSALVRFGKEAVQTKLFPTLPVQNSLPNRTAPPPEQSEPEKPPAPPPEIDRIAMQIPEILRDWWSNNPVTPR